MLVGPSARSQISKLGVGRGVIYSTRKNSIVSKTRQLGGHGPKTDRNIVGDKDYNELIVITVMFEGFVDK